jgi:WD40 repeat protein
MEAPAPTAQKRGPAWQAGAHAVAAAFDQSGDLAAVVLGDGTATLFEPGAPQSAAKTLHAHDGACLCLCADIDDGAFISGGDDGRLVRLSNSGTETLAESPGRWIADVAAHRAAGLRAFAAGREVVRLPRGRPQRSQPLHHTSTVAAIAFSPNGRRLAAAHYCAVSLWWSAADASKPRLLPWRGSHLGVSWSPDGQYVVSSMQDCCLHVWRVANGADLRMDGYPAKVKSISWTIKGRTLLTSGADRVVGWPFSGAGPANKQPVEFGPSGGPLVAVVAAHPTLDILAAGYEDGSLILVETKFGRAVPLLSPNGDPPTAIQWSPRGDWLILGTENGTLSQFDFRERSA